MTDFPTKCDLRFAKVTGVQWQVDGESSNLEKCCAQYKNRLPNTYWMCMNTCVVCCKKLVISFECEDPPGGVGQQKPESDAPRSYPNTTVNDNGISFTASSYGAPLPIVFGSDKLPGNVFWASPVYKTYYTTAFGPKYYQSVDFAVGLCEGEINGVLRMWLGDKLFYNNTLDTDSNGVVQPNSGGFIAGFTVDLTDPEGPLKGVTDSARMTQVSVFTGSEYQLPEGIMTDREGFENVPGYRGVAYVLFKNFIVTDSSVPSLSVELTSNTESVFPRIYGNPETPEVFFDQPTADAIYVDPSYSNVYVPMEDSNSSATPPDGRGISVFEYNDMTLSDEFEIDVTEGFTTRYEVSRLLPSSGNLILHEQVGNAGTLRVYSPFAGIVLSSFGPGGGVSSHSLTAGFSALGKGSIAFTTVSSITGLVTDAFMAVGAVNQSLGFLEVDADGQITPVAVLNGVLPEDDARSVEFSPSPAFTAATPTFFDGGSTEGQHILMVVSSVSAPNTIYIGRVTVRTATTGISSPTYTAIDTLTTDELLGRGTAVQPQLVLMDPVDNCMIIFFYSTTTYGSLVIKYNPFTGTIVWKEQAKKFGNTGPGAGMANMTTQKYCWVGAAGDGIYSLDTAAGKCTTLADLVSDQNLPVNIGFTQYYDGTENTITYVTNTAQKHVVKTYLERVTRQTIELADIVRLLLARVGLLRTDTNIEDLTTLTLHGYTISSHQSLRTSFEELGQVFKYDVIESNGRIKYKTRGTDSGITIPYTDLGDVDEDGWMRSDDDNDISRIRKINLTYRDIDREYKDNVQSIILPNYASETFNNDSAIDVHVPIVLEAAEAKTLAEILLYAKLVYDTTHTLKLPPKYQNVDPGDVIDIQMSADVTDIESIRVRKTQIGADGSIEVEASQEDTDIYNDVVTLFGNTGRYDGSVFPQIPSRVDPFVIDIPFRSDTEAAATASSYYMFSTFLNYKNNATMVNDATAVIDSTDERVVPKVSRFPTWGIVTVPPADRQSFYSTDNESALRVRLMSNTGITPTSSTHAGLLASDQVNLCYVGGELLQFTTATDNLDGTWTFTGLHRAKFGTDMFVRTHTKGERFILLGDSNGVLETGAVRRIELATGDDPKHLVQFFLKSRNPMQPSTSMFWNPVNLRPWTVANLLGAYSGNDAVITWQRRTRYNGELPDDGDETAPLNETAEEYVIYLFTDPDAFNTDDTSTYLRRVELTTNSYTYLAADQTADGFVNTVDTLFFLVYQKGSVTNAPAGAGKTWQMEPKA